jgi:hypothetical protein
MAHANAKPAKQDFVQIAHVTLQGKSLAHSFIAHTIQSPNDFVFSIQVFSSDTTSLV